MGEMTLPGYPRNFLLLFWCVALGAVGTGFALAPGMIHLKFAMDVPWALDAAQRTLIAALHFVISIVLIAHVGALWSIHMRRFWRLKKNRASGLVLAFALAMLLLSAAGIYYFGDETLSAASSILHTALGAAVGFLLALHLIIGKSGKMARKEHQ